MNHIKTGQPYFTLSNIEINQTIFSKMEKNIHTSFNNEILKYWQNFRYWLIFKSSIKHLKAK